MTRDEFEEAKRYLAEISALLTEGNLTPEEKQRLEISSAQLAGTLCSTWLPFGWGRRTAMIALFLVGALGLVVGNIYFLIAWLFVPLFSPRFVGECAYLLGRLSSSNG